MRALLNAAGHDRNSKIWHLVSLYRLMHRIRDVLSTNDVFAMRQLASSVSEYRRALG